jgi:uncharacterized protein
MSSNHGKFCWYELMTTDTEAAKRFYGELVGWKVQPVEMPGMDYAMWQKPGGGEIGGVSTLPPEAAAMGAPPHWLLHVAVDEVDGAVAKARDLGAQVHVPPTDIPGYGRFAVLADPQGGTFGVYKGNQDYEATGVDQALGGISWHELMTSDLEGAKKFYTALFGWKETATMDMGPEMGTYWMFGHTDKSYGGMMKRSPQMPVTAWVAYVTVPDTRKVVERVPQLGGQVLYGPQEVPGGGIVAMGLDPQGAAFAVYSEDKKA